MSQSNALAPKKATRPKKVVGSLPPVWRRVDREYVTPDNIVMTRVKSLTREDRPGVKAPEHHQQICLKTGTVRCSCEHFRYRLAKLNPHLTCKATWCKHILRAVDGCKRRNEVEFVKDEKGHIIGAVPTFDAPVPVGNSFDPEFDEYAEELENTERQQAAEQGSDLDPNDPFFSEPLDVTILTGSDWTPYPAFTSPAFNS